MYGIYKITFTARMWDDSIEDPNWTRKLPFVNDASTYIRIKPSPLTAMLIQGGVSLMTRGKGQSVVLEPFLFSEDPDFPEDGVSRFDYEKRLIALASFACNFIIFINYGSYFDILRGYIMWQYCVPCKLGSTHSYVLTNYVS